MTYRVTALYKFAALDDFKAMREPLLDFCREHQITGTLLLAEEGVNGTIAGRPDDISAVLDYLRNNERLSDIQYKDSSSPDNPFVRMKVKLKKEIVTLGVDGIDPNQAVGQYVKPEDWNALLSDPEVLLLDTRNDYEVDVGTFKGALNPNTETFKEFPEYVAQNLDKGKHRKVAMFCTGGIRCEKASAYMLQEGFDEVYHLQGGILKYLEEVPEEESLWQGECFVFDRRVAVDHHLNPGSYGMCYACRRPISDDDKASADYQEGVSCPRCINEYSEEDRKRFAQRQRQIKLAKESSRAHIGASDVEIKQARAEKQARKEEQRQRPKAAGK